jgi:hypothetical protein
MRASGTSSSSARSIRWARSPPESWIAASPASQASQRGMASASRLENLEISSWLRRALSAYSFSERPSGQAW